MMLDDSQPYPYPRRPPYISPSMSAPTFSSFSTHNSRSSPSSNPRFSFSSSVSFSQNPRIAVALIPAGLFLLDLGGPVVAGTLTVGLMISYILDSLRLKSAAFFGVWFSLFASQLAFFFTSASFSLVHSLPLSILSILLCAQHNFLIGVWASLQFRWIQIESPSIVLALERLLFVSVPVACPALFTWATIAALGLGQATAYYLAALTCVFYYLFSLPRPSSFKPISGNPNPNDDSYILGPLESCFHTLNLLFLPVAFHIGVHHATLFSSASSVCDLLLLFFVPFLFLLYASTHGALWWVSKHQHQIQKIRVVNGAVALIVVVICLEIRVVFHSFGKYLHVPPPLNYLLVTVAMLGGGSAGGAYAVGLVGDTFSSAAFTVMSVLVSAAGAIVVAFPLWLLPLPLISGFYVARFFTKKSLPSYFAFVLLASLMVAWFVVHNFWDLNIWLAGMSLKSFCKMVVASVILAMAIPGLALLPPKFRFAAEVGLISHALLLCHIENRFFTYTGLYYFGLEDDVIYPSYMLILTTFLGLALVRRLVLDHRIGPKAVWLLTCLYLSKLSMLFITSKSVVWVSAVLLLAVSPPSLLYKDKLKAGPRMRPWQGFTHGGLIVISAWFCRETIFEVLRWWNGRAPSDGVLLGSYILLTGLACIPIVTIHFSHVQSAKRFLVLVVATGLLFILVQPPVPLSWALESELIRASHQPADDISIYGFVSSRPTWPSWLLIATILLTLSAVTSIIPIKYVAELRAFYAVGVGMTLGIYICAEYFLQVVVIHALIVAAVVCATVFMVFTHLPSASSTRFLPWVFALLVALFPVTYLLEGQFRVTIGEGEGDKLTTLLAIGGARMSLLGLYATLFMLIALEIKYELASLIRGKALDRDGSVTQTGRNSGHPLKLRFVQQRKGSAPSFTVKRLAAEGAWMAAVGNVSTILCFIICLILSINLTGGSNRAIFLLAPILLLLNQDMDLFAGFGDRQRYFPVSVAISGYLILTALYRIMEEVWHGDAGWGLEIGGPGWFFAVKNAALLVLTLTNHILFNRFLWDYVKQTDAMLLLTMPLNLPSIIITDIITIRVLGLLGVIYSLVQYLVSRQIRIAGLKYI
ncbi:uncharacterized protein [Aristolochia californica]|uniref:uncharacterized protein n=1 Tax=Aristolochia californica TaxID=171875 RepID=UPI0035E142C3